MSVGLNNANYYGAGAGVDSYTGTGASRFIPEIWSGKLQTKFYQSTVLHAICNTDWEGEIKDAGDKVAIRGIPDITISNYYKGMTLATQIPTSTSITLNIDKAKYFNVNADDVDKTQADLQLLDIFSNDAANKMKIAVDTDVLLGIVDAAATGNKGQTAGVISTDLNLGDGVNATVGSRRSMPIVVGASTATTRSPLDFLVDMAQALDEQNVPEEGRFVVVPAWFAAMVKKSDLRNASITGDSVSISRNGHVGMIDRFNVYVSNLLPFQTGITDVAGGTSKKGFHIYAGTKAAVSFASQVTKVEKLRSTTTFGDQLRGLNVYGYKATLPAALVEGFVSR